MEMQKGFCDICRNDVNYVIKEVQLKGNLKGEEYIYSGKIAYCEECGNEIYVAEVNDFNLAALYDVYREKSGMISLEKILEIPKKYAIGKRPLSLLLGWGEQTFSRYCEGDMPTKQYSEILQRIYDDPSYYADILERNKDNLKSAVSYAKSKQATDTLLNKPQAEITKINQSIQYVLNKCEDITPLSLQKTLYYIQGFFYAFYQSFLFSEDCEAWVHGPVYRDVYNQYRDYRFDPIKADVPFDDFDFSSAEKAVMDSVIKNISCYSGKVLERFTHSETPWITARGELPESVASNKIMPKESIGSYFNTVKSKYGMINPSDIKSYAQNMFEHL